MTAPIIVFTFVRLEHLKKVISALLLNNLAMESDVFFVSDQGRTNEEKLQVAKVREYINSISGFRSITIIEREINCGIEFNEIDAISSIIDIYGKAIMIEDDIQVSNCFLEFINKGLDKYELKKEVFSVTGYSFISEKEINPLWPKYSYNSLASAWGWGTWKDRWDKLVQEIEMNELSIFRDYKIYQRFNRGYCYAEMLFDQILNKKITWDIRWYWTVFVNNGVTLFPVKSMVNNIGMNGTGTHYTDSNGVNRIEEINANITEICLDNIWYDTRVDDAIKRELRNMMGIRKCWMIRELLKYFKFRYRLWREKII